ncbi:hypothetical protein HDA40_007930 [Hamadaea flava]|nr:hypothetical protein [Hamadaea flava]
MLAEAFVGVNMLPRAISADLPVLLKSATGYLGDEWEGQAEPPRERQRTALGLMLRFLSHWLDGAGVACLSSTAMWN